MRTYEQVLDEMGKSETHELESRLAVIIAHALKVRHVKGRVGAENVRGWRKSIRDQVLQLTDLIQENPGLKPRITDDLLDRVYRSVLADLTRQYATCAFPRARELSMKDIVGNSVFASLKRR